MEELVKHGCLELLIAYIMRETGCSENFAADLADKIYPSVDMLIYNEM